MFTVNDYFHYLIDVALIQWYGWVPFFGALVYMIYWLKRENNRNAWIAKVKWIFLEVKVDELNEKSPLAMEQVFAALHVIQTNFTFGEDYAGNQVLNVSCEIVSIGGRVSYIFRIPERYRTLLESSIFAQYPKAEINEVEDYLRNLPHFYDPHTADFDFAGGQLNKKKESAYPIRTYASDQSFEHGAQETFIDPLSNVLEVMSNVQPHELLALQMVIKPVTDDWKDHATHLLDKLKGVPAHHEEPAWLKVVLFIPEILSKFLVDIVTGAGDGEDAKPQKAKEEPPSQMQHKSDVEKKVISSIENGLGKISYEVRYRLLYLAPKDKLNKSLRLPEIIGAIRNFDDVNLNGLKPDIGHTWTSKAYKLSERLERPYTEMNVLTRKRHLLHNFVSRSHWRGSDKFKMNVEELATIFHFPQVPHSRVSQLAKVHTVKSAPPMDLPIG